MARFSGLAIMVVLGLAGAVPVSADRDARTVAESAPESADSRQVFLGVSARYFGYSPEAISEYARRYGARDDLAVTLFVATRSRRSPEQIHQLRLRGLFWWEISTMNELAGDVWFTELDGERPEDPVFEPAYRQLERWNRGEVRHLEITDEEVRNLVAVRVIHDVFDLPVARAMELRSTGRELPAIVSEQYRLRDRGSASAPAGGAAGNGTVSGRGSPGSGGVQE